ncbi:hypothetical protein ACRAWF_43555 [Streptomyces sp. L7]
MPGRPAAPAPTPSRFNPSGRYQYDRKTDRPDTLSSTTSTNRTPTQSGLQHRITADVTYLIRIRSGHRNVLANTFGYGPGEDVTLAVDVPRGLQFLMTESQLRRDGRWMGAFDPALPAPSTTGLTRPSLPPRYVHDGTLGLATVNSVTEFADPGTGPGANPRAEQRARLQRETRELVERYAPGVTTPGHASYLPGVAALIADNTGVTGEAGPDRARQRTGQVQLPAPPVRRIGTGRGDVLGPPHDHRRGPRHGAGHRGAGRQVRYRAVGFAHGGGPLVLLPGEPAAPPHRQPDRPLQPPRHRRPYRPARPLRPPGPLDRQVRQTGPHRRGPVLAAHRQRRRLRRPGLRVGRHGPHHDGHRLATQRAGRAGAARSHRLGRRRRADPLLAQPHPLR